MTAVAATVWAATGCGSATTRSAGTGSNADIEALYRARIDSARTRFTEADARFITGMIAHHAQAIVMARWAPTHGASATVLTLTGRIINAQQDEIGLMQQWLRDRKLPVPEVTPAGTDSHAGHGAHMPGMLTPEQLRQLDQARGAAFDRLFLTLMIQHHRGAVTMVDELFKAGGAGQDDAVFKIASDVQVDQITEINRMEQMLAALPRGLP
jgi:uncharacterized protein (DUF305 family)